MSKRRKTPAPQVIKFPRPNLRELRAKFPRPITIRPPRIDWRTPPGNPEPRE